MRFWKIIFGLLLLLVLTACAERNQLKVPSKEPVIPEDVETAEIPSREAIFVYREQNDLPSRIVLTLASEPLLLPSGYVRLVGVVSGSKPIACLEIGGRGLVLGEGEMIDGYRIGRIGYDNVLLERGR